MYLKLCAVSSSSMKSWCKNTKSFGKTQTFAKFCLSLTGVDSHRVLNVKLLSSFK